MNPGAIIAIIVVIIIVAIYILFVGKQKNTFTSATIDNIANDADNFMTKSMNEAASLATIKNAYYPIMLISDGCSLFSLKTSKKSNVLTFNYLDGIMPVWDWGKGVCHLIVWIGSVASILGNNSKYDWKTNLKTQQSNITKLISSLSDTIKYIDSIRNTTSINSKYTSTAPIIINATSNDIKMVASNILKIFNDFCNTYLTSDIAPTETEITAVSCGRKCF